jgi:2-polyprenyl-6-methoxyphenol hydroxylase-like FAD-dependent oxidoreductase
VLIVGAGPTGLMMARQLLRFGIPFRLIEKNGNETCSRSRITTLGLPAAMRGLTSIDDATKPRS